MVQPAKTFYTPEEYLALEATSEIRHEYYQGEIYAMAGGSANHNQITINMVVALETALSKKPCRVFASDMRLLVKPSGLYTYPDVMVVCRRIEFEEDRTDIITNPSVIVEVLSKSTEGYDRGVKFIIYQNLSTLQDYVSIDQSQMRVDYYQRGERRKWILEMLDQLDDRLTLHSLNLTIPLSQIYNKVDWQATSSG